MMDEGYCDYCEREGHTFSTCPARDDSFEEDGYPENLGPES